MGTRVYIDCRERRGQADHSEADADRCSEGCFRCTLHCLLSFKVTLEKVKARSVFESKFKRLYFHFKPVSQNDITNWRAYLDWELIHGTTVRVGLDYDIGFDYYTLRALFDPLCIL